MIDRRRRFVLGGAAATAATTALAPADLFARSFGYPRLMEGPLVGPPGPTHLTVWGRASGTHTLAVEYSRKRDLSGARTTAPVQANTATDYTGALRIDGLEPDTVYYYRVLVDGIVDRYQQEPFATRTAPAAPADFRVAFGSCARIVRDSVQRVWDGVAVQEPDLFFWLGDNIYADSDSPEAIAGEYRRQRSVERLRRLNRHVPQLAVWDDHDFGYNNSDGTSPYKDASLEVFRRYWPNPAYGQPGTPGVFFDYSYGGVDFHFLDGRYYRSPNGDPDGPAKTMLGAGQLRWLEQKLVASRAPFKILIAGSGWSQADGPQGDTWAAFRRERDALFDFIRDRGIEGVVCLSGDSHVGELNCIPWSERGGYDFYDLVSSPLAQWASDSWVTQSPERRMRKVYAGGANFGLLDFRMAGRDGAEPSLTFTLHDPSGNRVQEPFVLTPSDLRNGVESWRRKIIPRPG